MGASIANLAELRKFAGARMGTKTCTEVGGHESQERTSALAFAHAIPSLVGARVVPGAS